MKIALASGRNVGLVEHTAQHDRGKGESAPSTCLKREAPSGTGSLDAIRGTTVTGGCRQNTCMLRRHPKGNTLFFNCMTFKELQVEAFLFYFLSLSRTVSFAVNEEL